MWGQYAIRSSLTLVSAEEPKAAVAVPKPIDLTVPTIRKGMADCNNSTIQAAGLKPTSASAEP